MTDNTKTERMRRYRAKLKGDGFVSVTVKVPADKRETIIKQAAMLRGE